MARALAGAAARLGEVSVLAPGRPAQQTADGLFDVQGVPDDGDLSQIAASSPDSVVIVDELGTDIASALSSADFRAGFYLTASEDAAAPRWRRLALVGDPGTTPVGPYVAVNPLAARHRHHGFGFTGYVLILYDPEEQPDPPPAATWLAAALPDADLVVVADAFAAAWKGGTLRGRVGIDTRTDLWRLMAHASVCIDLAPGSLIGLECIEALRFGTPVIVPGNAGPATAHAHASGARTFAGADELVAATLEMQVPDKRANASAAGKSYADEYFGDPDRFVANLAALWSE